MTFLNLTIAAQQAILNQNEQGNLWMLGLFIDTANQNLHLLLLQDSNVIASVTNPQTQDQAANLLPAIEQLLQQAHSSYAALDYIAVLSGKGSFTGIRIALTTAKLLKLLLQIPVLTCTTFELSSYVHQFPSNCMLLSSADTHKLYCSEFHAGILIHTTLATLQDLPPQSPVVYLEALAATQHSELLQQYPQAIVISSQITDQQLANYLHTQFNKHDSAFWLQQYIEPLYIREPDINCKYLPQQEPAHVS